MFMCIHSWTGKHMNKDLSPLAACCYSLPTIYLPIYPSNTCLSPHFCTFFCILPCTSSSLSPTISFCLPLPPPPPPTISNSLSLSATGRLGSETGRIQDQWRTRWNRTDRLGWWCSTCIACPLPTQAFSPSPSPIPNHFTFASCGSALLTL